MKISTRSAIIIASLAAVISAALTSVIWLLVAQHPAEVVETTVATPRNITADKANHHDNLSSKVNQTGQSTALYSTVAPQEKPTADKFKYHHELVANVNQIGQWTARYNTVGPREARCDGDESGIMNIANVIQARPDDGMRSHFDSRKNWPHCTLLQQPSLNQGSCGSCWAAAATSAIADRICIATNGRQQPRLSVLDVLCSVARIRGVEARGLCAAGGAPVDAYEIWNMTGIVTGGIYGSADGCMPYQFSGACGSPCPVSSEPMELLCSAECQPWYSKGYNDDKYYGKNTTVVLVGPDDEFHESLVLVKITLNPIPLVQRALTDTGPVTGFIDVFEDFLHYGSGVYRYTEGKHCYGHLVKIIGWGRQNGVDYWIIANSWGETWGEVGFGKVAMDHVKQYSFADVKL